MVRVVRRGRARALEIVSPGSVARLGELLTRVRRAPITGRTRDADGSRWTCASTRARWSTSSRTPASDPVICARARRVRARRAGRRRRAAAAARAGRPTPGTTRPSEASYFSRGQYLAVACADYPQLSDRTRRRRRSQPFTRRRVADDQRLLAALRRLRELAGPDPPPAAGAEPQAARVGAGADRRRRPRLADPDRRRARDRARTSARTSKIVTLRNTVHVTSEGDTYLVEGMRCARRVIRSFLRDAFSATCADTIVRLHTAELPAHARRRDARRRSSPAPTRARPRGAPRRSPPRRSPTRSSAATTPAAAAAAVPACAAASSQSRTRRSRSRASASWPTHTVDGTGTFHYATGARERHADRRGRDRRP